jgi:hypothetical protein
MTLPMKGEFELLYRAEAIDAFEQDDSELKTALVGLAIDFH